jgi:transcriptional regulator with XRE-family HTH domain
MIELMLALYYLFRMANRSKADRRIAAQIRIERESRGWSSSELGARSLISRSMIDKIERCYSNPTARVLAQLCDAFNLSMSTFIARADAQSARLLRKANQPEWIDPENRCVRRHVSPRSALPVDLLRVELPSGAETPMSTSASAVLRQLVWVLQGSLAVMEGDTRLEIQEGDCIELGAPTDCVLKNESEVLCIYVVASVING